jgi:SHS2 domain-containing protein
LGCYEVFEHTADLGLRVMGEDLDDLFRTAAEALLDQVVENRQEIRPLNRVEVALTAETTEDLLAHWLTEILYRIETEHRVFGRFEARVAPNGQSLTGLLVGEPIDRTRHVLDHEVKAVTRHGLRVERSGIGWLAEFILDI